jgi:hypothetical protein
MLNLWLAIAFEAPRRGGSGSGGGLGGVLGCGPGVGPGVDACML